MPIFLIKDLPIIASKTEFLSEYFKLDTKSISPDEDLYLTHVDVDFYVSYNNNLR